MPDKNTRSNASNGKSDVLDANTALMERIGQALEDDPRTEQTGIEIINEQGIVTLQGQVASPQVKAAAAEIAGQQPGVVEVINELRVKPGDGAELERAETQGLRASQPPIVPPEAYGHE